MILVVVFTSFTGRLIELIFRCSVRGYSENFQFRPIFHFSLYYGTDEDEYESIELKFLQFEEPDQQSIEMSDDENVPNPPKKNNFIKPQ